MNTTRVGLTALLGTALLVLVADPVVAQATAESTTESAIWNLNSWLLYLAVPIAVLVEGILIYTVWKYRRNENPLPTRENRRLEIVWTIATAIVLVAVGVGSYTVMANPYVTNSQADVPAEEEPLEVQVVAQKYSWTFEYPTETVAAVTGESTTVTNGGTLVLPTDRPVELNVTSRDWLHSFHVPALALKQDAFPGRSQPITTVVEESGTYQLYCAEYCGVGHSGMLGTVDARSQADFRAWLADQAGG